MAAEPPPEAAKVALSAQIPDCLLEAVGVSLETFESPLTMDLNRESWTVIIMSANVCSSLLLPSCQAAKISEKTEVNDGKLSTDEGKTRLGPKVPKRPANLDAMGAGLGAGSDKIEGREGDGAKIRNESVGGPADNG
jgi:hypothetical protein